MVFLAIDPDLNRPVALKLPLAEALLKAEVRHRFVREAKASAALDHPNLVPLYEAGEIDSICYLVSAYCEGPTLSAWLREQQSAVPPDLAAQLVAEMANAVQHSHERGVLHRDFKPSNVIMDMGRREWFQGERAPEGSLEPAFQRLTRRVSRARLTLTAPRRAPARRRLAIRSLASRTLDWLASWRRQARRRRSVSGPWARRPTWLPNRLKGRKSDRPPTSTAWARSSTFFSAIAAPSRRRRPRHAAPGCERRSRRTACPAPDVPRDLEAVCLKCLNKDASRRYPSALEFSDDLCRFLAGQPTRAPTAGRWEKLRRAVKRMPAGITVLAIVASSVVLLLAVAQRYQTQLNVVHRQAQDVRAKTKSLEAHSNYGRTMRQAEELVRQSKAPAAIATLLALRPNPGEEDLREFAWYHLMSRFQTEQRILKGHRDDIYHVAFSPRGDLLASWSKDGTVCLWSTSSWELIRRITAAAKQVNAGAFAPDGKSLVTVGDEGKLKVWETATGRKLVDVQAHPFDAVIAFFTKDGDTIITGGRYDGVIKFWNSGGAEQGKLVTGKGPLKSVALNPDGSILATAGKEGLTLWDVAKRTLRSVLSPLTGAKTVVFSHDGTKLAAAFDPGRLIAFDTANGKIKREFQESYAGSCGAVFSSDDRTISSSDNEGVIRHWDVLSGQPRGVHIGHAGRVWTLALSPAADMLASAGQDATVRIWKGEGFRESLKIAGGMVGFADGGRTVLVLEAGNPRSLGRWDARSGALLDRMPIDLGIHHLSQFTNDGQALLSINKQGEVNEWNVKTGPGNAPSLLRPASFTF